ncbi:MAG: pyridoxal phosphate-dependent aminotransferase [Fervidobacterium sp.]|uniref:pyridoxal phosphate-dependent aminotransferase n=1 Tax=Fervidobacterium sp. TaxID=1871331 RepID=UPI00404B1549
MRIFESVLNRAFPYETEKRTERYLALNENPFDFPKEIIDRAFVKELELSNLKIYYDSPDESLIERILDYLGAVFLDRKNVSIGNGADEIIYVTMLMFKRVVFFPPTYSCYKVFAKALGVEFLELPLEDGVYIPDVDVKEGDVVFVPNPNNPTGHLFGSDEIEKLLRKGAFVALDEAYYEFSKVTYLELLNRYDNLAIIRTFSKAFSLAGQRVGYVVSSASFVDAYNRVRLPFNVSYISQLLARLALENYQIFEERINWIMNERERMKENLRSFGYRISDSRGNFVFVYLDANEKNVILQRLSDKGIAVRNFKDGIRISIGLREENEIILNVLGGLRESNKLEGLT